MEEEEEKIKCTWCEEEIEPEDRCYQIGKGNIEDGEFFPEEDYIYLHEVNCMEGWQGICKGAKADMLKKAKEEKDG